ncbi:hypothetical protein DC345_30305 [Paenibacillus taichungensis]|uniref:Uncharacterized protein n=1 Tax=Paenibacillus taichungensis TaxID=484184 RepID=A0A329QBH3_9BACL|nr:hypothetical protein [Paenibacillus taichungensis]RAW09755.1 hypothetical protein DC345_30305 [Paenibacillus taichungensis]
MKSQLEYTKKLFLRTDQYFRTVLNLMEGDRYKTISSLGMSVDNLPRDYNKVLILFDELDLIELSEIQDNDITLFNTKTNVFKESYFRLFHIFEEALQKVYNNLKK